MGFAKSIISLCAFIFYILVLDISLATSQKPHIVIILADDLGWSDVSFHGDQIPTPNIDALAYNGVILNNHYVQQICTPSRAALMTGKYPINLGMQSTPLYGAENRGVPLSEKLLPKYLKDLGYSTHLIGKWHLGFSKRAYTPLKRGFDSHVGYWNGAISYFDHIFQDDGYLPYSGRDMRRNYTPAWDLGGKYATDIFADEAVNVIESHPSQKPLFLFLSHLAPHAGNEGKWLEAPQEEIDKFTYIHDPNRRTYAVFGGVTAVLSWPTRQSRGVKSLSGLMVLGSRRRSPVRSSRYGHHHQTKAMVSKLDESVGKVVSALKQKGMLENSVILFLSDNGAPNTIYFKNWGSNFPFRGEKGTLWEGGVKTPALVWSPLIKFPSRVVTDLMHITDWVPTFVALAGGKVLGEKTGHDGHNQWDTISFGATTPRKEVLIDINEVHKREAIRVHKYKYINGPSRSETQDGYLNRVTIKAGPIPDYGINSIVSSPAWQSIRGLTKVNALESHITNLRTSSIVDCKNSQQPSQCHDSPCLFDLELDPCEEKDLSRVYPTLMEYIQTRLDAYRTKLVPQSKFVLDPEANPEKFNYTWSIWTK